MRVVAPLKSLRAGTKRTTVVKDSPAERLGGEENQASSSREKKCREELYPRVFFDHPPKLGHAPIEARSRPSTDDDQATTVVVPTAVGVLDLLLRRSRLESLNRLLTP